MTDNEPTPPSDEAYESPAVLHFDRENPRAPGQTFSDETAVLKYLADWFDVGELVLAIAHSGWYDYEPLIVLVPGNTVLEGNRRLAALRILADPELGRSLNVPIPEKIVARARPDRIQIRRVDSRSEARAFIGFKHVNGAFKWDAVAKAKFAADWYAEEPDIEAIARRLGDTHHTVLRLVNGWNVLQQSQKLGFDMTQCTRQRFALSHLYTAVARPNVRGFLGLGDTPKAEALGRDPVPESHSEQLLSFMSWLYGQKDQPTVIGSQNPDLNRLATVLGNRAATAMLEATRNLDKAYGETESKSVLFAESLMLATQHAEEASRLLGHYEGQEDLLRAGGSLRKTATSLHLSMKQTAAQTGSGDAD